MQAVILIDGMNVFIRNFVVNPTLNSDGEPVGGTIGFLRMLAKLVRTYRPKQVIIAWEGGGSKRKRQLFSEYKDNRKPWNLNRFYDGIDSKQNKLFQIKSTVELVNHLPVCQVYVGDCEADDVIGYLSTYSYIDREQLLVTSDKDFYQLLRPGVRLYSPNKKHVIDASHVVEEYGITACNFAVAKAIVGDPSDNVPGVKGIGFKTLAKRFPFLGENEEHSLDEVFEACEKAVDEGASLKLYKNVLDGRDVVLRNWKLMFLGQQMLSFDQIRAIDKSVAEFEPRADPLGFVSALRKLGVPDFDAAFCHTFNYLTLKH